MKINFSLFQQYIARILLISLCLQSCSGGFNNNPLILNQEEQISSIQTNTQAILPRADIQPLADQVLTAEGGHAVTFYEEAGELKADVIVNAPEGFSKTYEGLSVTLEQGTEISNLPRLDKKAQQRRIRLQQARAGKPAKVVIYKGAGLMGGGESEDEQEEEQPIKHKQSKKDKEKISDGEKLEGYDLFDICPANYIPGQFQYMENIEEEDKIELSASPYRPAQAPKQCTKFYRGKPQMLPYERRQQESVLMRVKKGQDGRIRIEQTTEFPYLFNGQLELHYSNGEYGGSGTLIGPQHILTAAHNIYNKKRGWAERVVVRLGLNGKIAPYGDVLATRIYTFKPYINQEDPAYDMALLVLERPIGMLTGWCGLLAAADKELQAHKVSITGYPGDKGCKQMWSMTHTLKQVLPKELIYEIDTYGGQSGSGICLNKWSSPYVVGVHTLGRDPLTGIGNSGVRLSYSKAKQVIKWIEETIAFKQNIQHLPIPTEVLPERTIDVLATQAREGDPRALMKLFDASERGNAYAQLILGMMYMDGAGVAQNFNRAVELFNEAAKAGNANAQYNLGGMYENGKGVEKDYQRAVEWYKRAAYQGHTDARKGLDRLDQIVTSVTRKDPDYTSGRIVDKDEPKPIKWYLKAAEQGDMDAQYKLGKMYENGEGVRKNYKKAVEWYQKAADQGYAEAQYSLGCMYHHGNGVTQNDEATLKWHQKAAGQGHAGAQNGLGWMYHTGCEVNKDYAKAFEWYEKAAEQGDAKAQNNLAIMYKEGKGVAQNDKKAFEWFQKAAEQGYAKAQNILGEMYENGEGVRKNYKKAVEWYEKAAKQGYARAQFNLADMYENDKGVKKNYKKAFEWYEKAAEQGDANAQYNLAAMYKKGQGVAQSYKKAFEWFQKAAEQGDMDAQCSLGRMYDKGKGVAQDDKKAFEWYEKAAEQKDVDAQYSLAAMYDKGKGVAQDDKKAFEWYEKAAEQGDATAQNNLAAMYEGGQGVRKNYKKAVEWFQKAAEQGLAEAQNNLAAMYEEGQGVRKDYKKAVEWYEKAAEQGDVDAQAKIKKLSKLLRGE